MGNRLYTHNQLEVTCLLEGLVNSDFMEQFHKSSTSDMLWGRSKIHYPELIFPENMKTYIRTEKPIKAIKLQRTRASIKAVLDAIKNGKQYDDEPGWEPEDQKDFIETVMKRQDPMNPDEKAKGYVLMLNNTFTVVDFGNYIVINDDGTFKQWRQDLFEEEYKVKK